MMFPDLSMRPFAYVIRASIGLVFLSTLLFCLLQPIYIDEILAPSVLGGRLIYDNGRFISGFAQCGPGFSQLVPTLFIPGRLVAWALHATFHTLVGIRIMGLWSLALWSGLMAWTVRLYWGKMPPSLTFLGIMAWVWVGVMPGISILTRPETLMACCIIFFCALPRYFKLHPDLPPRRLYMLLGVFTLCVSWFFLAHAKAFFFVPLMLVAGWSFPLKNPRLRWGIIALIALMTFQQYQFWNTRYTCPNVPTKQGIIESRALMPHQLWDNPITVLEQMGNNLLQSDRYFGYLLFSEQYHSQWLPPITLGLGHKLVNAAISLLGLGWLIMVCLALRDTVRDIRENKKPASETWLAPSLIIGTCFTLCLLYNEQRFYDAGLYWELALLVWVMAVAPHIQKALYAKTLRRAFIALIIISLSSQILLVSTFGMQQYERQHADPNGDMHTAELSQSIYNYKERREKIYHAASQCGIDPQAENTHLVVDVFTYLPFMQSREPYFSRYVTVDFREGDNVFTFLERKHSSGVIALCSSLHDNLSSIATRENGICCIAPEKLRAQ